MDSTRTGEGAPNDRSNELRIYRSPSLDIATLVIVLIAAGAAIFYLVNPGPSPGTNVVLSIFFVLLAVIIAANQVLSRLRVSGQGLTYVVFLRKKTIHWSEVRSIGVSPYGMVGPWSSLRVETDRKAVNIRTIAGPKSYLDRIVAEIQAATPR
jgi:hypothetical protein